MTTAHWIIVIAIFVAVDCVVVWAVVSGAVSGWNDLVRSFPAEAPAADAVAKRFQSIKADMVNMGKSVHIAADAERLHLTPVWLMRKLGMQSVSIPWDAMTLKRRGKWWTSVRVGGSTVTGPSWCFELVGAGVGGRGSGVGVGEDEAEGRREEH